MKPLILPMLVAAFCMTPQDPVPQPVPGGDEGASVTQGQLFGFARKSFEGQLLKSMRDEGYGIAIRFAVRTQMRLNPWKAAAIKDAFVDRAQQYAAEHGVTLSTAVQADGERDWEAFFAGLIELLKVLLPIIIQLFSERVDVVGYSPPPDAAYVNHWQMAA